MTNRSEAPKLYKEILDNTSKIDLDMAKQLFAEYTDKGVLRDCAFEDSKWNATNEYENVGLSFKVSQLAYKRNYEDLLAMTYDDFVLHLKAYVLSSFSTYVLPANRELLYDIRNIIMLPPCDVLNVLDRVYMHEPSRILDFFSMLPLAVEIDQTNDFAVFYDRLEDLELLALSRQSSSGKKRALAPFYSYLLFDDIINDWWKLDLPQAERLFYAPLYFWWNTSNVIPQRPREFILTPRDCIVTKADGRYMTILHSRLKGSDRTVTNTIEGDYEKQIIKLPDWLADEFEKYIEMTEEYADTDIHTLFVTDPHYAKWGTTTKTNNRYFTYINLNTVMRYFFEEVIARRYGLKVIYDRSNNVNQPGTINYIHLGDIRHLSIINIILSGCSLDTARLLAGHASVNTTSHYYSNLESIVEANVYSQYRKVLGGKIEYTLSKYEKPPLNIADYVSLEDGARCYSKNYANYEFCDCEKVIGPNGEVGYCPWCTFHRKKESVNFFADDNMYRARIEEACNHLAKNVHLYRQHRGNAEDILQAVKRCQTSSYTYRQYLEEKIMNGGNENGTT